MKYKENDSRRILGDDFFDEVIGIAVEQGWVEEMPRSTRRLFPEEDAE